MGLVLFSYAGLALAGFGLSNLGLVGFGWARLRWAGERTRLGWAVGLSGLTTAGCGSNEISSPWLGWNELA